MNQTHKGHNIVISIMRFGGMRQWKPQVKIIWSEDGEGKISTLNVNGAFGAKEEAEKGGLLFAKKWIDDGKPVHLTTIPVLKTHDSR